MTSTIDKTARIYGEEIFFNFIEVPAADMERSGDLVHQIKTKALDGFVMKDVFSAEEVRAILDELKQVTAEELMNTPSGQIFPAPFAVLTDTGERLDDYYKRLGQFDAHRRRSTVVELLAQKLDGFFRGVGKNYKVSVPVNKVRDKAVAPGTFRIFQPGMGGLHVHLSLIHI